MTTFKAVKNRAVGNLDVGVDDSVSTWTLQSGQGADFPAANFWVTCENEHVLVSSRSSDVLTLTRAQNGTAAAAHSAGVAVELRVISQTLDDIHDAVNTLEGQVGNVDTLLIESFAGMAVALIDGAALLTTVGLLGRFRLSHRLTFAKLSYLAGVAGSANAVISFAIFSGDGATQYLDEDDAVGASTGPQTITFTAVSLPPGDYYVFVTMSSGTTGPQLKHWDTGTQDLVNANVPSGEPVYEGSLSISSGVVPATIDPTAISAAPDSSPFVRLDTV